MCAPHQWGDTIYDPIREEAYTIPGDPPGTMGIDWRGPTPVPAKTTDRWSRTCNRCGRTETTTHFVPSGDRVPKF
jgi:hypothetical protein